MLTCLACGAANREGARFCDACGENLAPDAPERESRKTVTIVFCDVTGSTELGERLDAESLRKVMSTYFEAMRAVLERHGGTVQKFIGDAVMAVFGIPQIHEDDALRAVRATAGMREALGELNERLDREWGVRLASRTGVNTGETLVGEGSPGHSLVIGDPVNVAARLEQAAEPGEILIGETTYRLTRQAVTVERLEPIALKGKAEPVAAYRLLGVQTGVTAAAGSDAPMVGRTHELRLLTDAYERAVGERATQLITVLGVAGIGKSRLVAEAVAALSADTQVLFGRCLPYGEGITFWPVAEVVRQAAGIVESDTVDEARAKIEESVADEDDGSTIAARVAELIGVDPPRSSLEEGFWGLRKFLETLARRHPVLVTFDDLQWAEPALLDLIDHVVEWSRDAPIMVVCIARPEFLEVRPGWGGGKMNAISLLLEPLGDAECDAMVTELLASAQLSPTVRATVLEHAGGNPLFLEELLASLLEDGMADGADVLVPPTIQALLAARLERLGTEEQTTIEGASVVGQVFYRGAVTALAPEHVKPEVGAHLLALVRKDLVRPDRSTFAGEDAFKFRHILIRDAAYHAMPKQLRAELHERFADWLERAAGDRVAEYEEIVGYHLEQAFRYREELGPLDDRARALAEEAGKILGRAGVRATKRGDHNAAASLLTRALELCPNDPESVDWLMRAGRAHHINGQSEVARQHLEQAIAHAESFGDERLIWRARVAHQRFLIFVDAQWSPEAARALGEPARGALESLGDDYGLALTWRLLADADGYDGRYAGWAEGERHAADHARRSGDWDLMGSALCDREQALALGPAPVRDALDVCHQIAQENERRITEYFSRGMMALLHAMMGDFERSWELAGEADAGYVELGIGHRGDMRDELTGQICLLADDPVRAEAGFRATLQDLEDTGDVGLIVWIGGFLAEALYRQGKHEEADAYTRKIEQLATTDKFAECMWRGVRAKVLAQTGDLEEAERIAREALEISAGTDLIQLRGDLQMALAEVLTAAGRLDEAEEAIRDALALYEQKGNLVLAARARSMLEPTEVAG